MNKIDLLIFTKNNEVILVSQTDNYHIQNSVTELIEKYSSEDISEFDSIDDMILELDCLGINTTIFNLDITDLLNEED